MHLSNLTKAQWFSVLKAALYVSASAGLDFLISATSGTQFGLLTPIINVVLVTVKKALTDPEAK